MKDGTVLVEAESFEDLGGWALDTQFIHIMGSPYLIAHGLGTPVADAQTDVTLPSHGRWFVWVRTRNWVPGPWEAPGRFKVAINGEALPEIFGTGPDEWGWRSGGSIDLKDPGITLSLVDVTGFNGRCDAILFTQDEALVPDNDSQPMSRWRRDAGNVSTLPDQSFDLVVVGGGIAGVSAAVAAARLGLKVGLLHDRSVLHGNASPEVHVAPSGNFPPGRYPHLGDIVREIAPEITAEPETVEWFSELESHGRGVVDAEPGIELFLDHYVYDVETEGGLIRAVWALGTRGGQRRRFTARFFVDATGHGTVGLKAGADHTMEPGDRMGMTNTWRWRFGDTPTSFPEVPWALPLNEKGFPYPTDGGWATEDGEIAQPLRFTPVVTRGKGKWFWESGFNDHPLDDLEEIRDHNFRAAFGAWNAIKNHGAYAHLDESGSSHANAELYWMACIGGPRETLQLLGDVVVTKEDVYSQRDFPDACVPATWGIDLHYPLPLYAPEAPGKPFISRAHFDGRVDDTQGQWADSPKPCLLGPMRGVHDEEKGYLFPYRSFYSRNIDNLFMAGRDLSVTHDALGTIRVMNTLGMVGVVVGRAASIAFAHDTTPRGVYQDHLDDLKDLLSRPGDYRMDSTAASLKR